MYGREVDERDASRGNPTLFENATRVPSKHRDVSIVLAHVADMPTEGGPDARGQRTKNSCVDPLSNAAMLDDVKISGAADAEDAADAEADASKGADKADGSNEEEAKEAKEEEGVSERVHEEHEGGKSGKRAAATFSTRMRSTSNSSGGL